MFSGSIPKKKDSYCSQSRTLRQLPKTIPEGVLSINKILSNGVLCRHHVKDINKIYKEIVNLEKRVDKIPEINSSTALEEIVTKIKGIVRSKPIKAEGLISLYHLQKFSDKELHLDQLFSLAYARFQENPEHLVEIATHLPCCQSEANFDEDIAVLLESEPAEHIASTLEAKRKKLQAHEHKKRAIAEKKSELASLRANNPQHYPPYLDELLDYGYLHLYDHLLQMRELKDRNQRIAAIKQLSFSELAHIVVETRKAVIQKVISFIPIQRKFRDGEERKKVVIMFGPSGSGKTTSFCALRRDPMVFKDGHYISQSDQSGLIGHEGASSCTFLPAIEKVDDIYVIDYPGAEDTNGPLVSFGYECAFLFLIKEYHPRVLVMEAITNNEGRYAAAGHLGLRLGRLLETKEKCLLGITKYSKDSDFIKIKMIEEEQRKKIPQLEKKIRSLKEDIQKLAALNSPTLELIINEKKEKLAKIEKKRAALLEQPLPDTEEKKAARERLQKNKSDLLAQIGLENSLDFYDLEDPTRLIHFLTTIAAQEAVSVNPMRRLDDRDKGLIEERFKENLKEEIQKKKDVKPRPIDELEESVLISSLISTVCSSTPEIGEFLHMEEMCRRIVENLDIEIVDDSMNDQIGLIIGGLNFSLFQKMCEQLAGIAEKTKISELQEKIKEIRNFIMPLRNVPVPEDEAKAEMEWEKIRTEHEAAELAVEKDYEVAPWVNILLWAPLAIPKGIQTLLKMSDKSKASKQAATETINNCLTDLSKKYETLLRLGGIKQLIKKRRDLEIAFHSISQTESATTRAVVDLLDIKYERVPEIIDMSLKKMHAWCFELKSKIDQIREIYGEKEWDMRVTMLAKQFIVPTDFTIRFNNDIGYIKYFFILISSIGNILQGDAGVLDEVNGSNGFELLTDRYNIKERKNKAQQINGLVLEKKGTLETNFPLWRVFGTLIGNRIFSDLNLSCFQSLPNKHHFLMRSFIAAALFKAHNITGEKSKEK